MHTALRVAAEPGTRAEPDVSPGHESLAGLDRLGDEIAEVSAHLDAASARLLELIREFDARHGWANGFRSCAHWLSWRVGLDLGAARERVRVARALATLPRFGQALARGELSYAKVRALTRVATPGTEERLLAVGRAGTADHVERIVRGWRRVDWIAEAQESRRRHRSRGLHVYQDDDGMVVVRGRLEPEVGALLMKALEAGREALYQRRRAAAASGEGVGAVAEPGVMEPAAAPPPGAGVPDVSAETSASVSHPRGASQSHLGGAPGCAEPGVGDGPVVRTGLIDLDDLPTWGQQQADALGLIAETALHHGIEPGAPGERYQVVVHVDEPVLADPDAPGQSVLEDGTHVSAETSRRLACDATRVVMRHDADGNVVEVGARTRTIPPALRRVLQYRDRGCRFPGCGLPFGQGHHIRHWADGGPTTLSNLAMLCRRHHRAVHEDGFTMERECDGELGFRRPDGLLLPQVPAPAAVPADAVAAVRARNEGEGRQIGSRTATALWLGERLDVGYALDVLHPLAIGS
jgi:hypothetical protein